MNQSVGSLPDAEEALPEAAGSLLALPSEIVPPCDHPGALS
jgi:hypothetical protein